MHTHTRACVRTIVDSSIFHKVNIQVPPCTPIKKDNMTRNAGSLNTFLLTGDKIPTFWIWEKSYGNHLAILEHNSTRRLFWDHSPSCSGVRTMGSTGSSFGTLFVAQRPQSQGNVSVIQVPGWLTTSFFMSLVRVERGMIPQVGGWNNRHLLPMPLQAGSLRSGCGEDPLCGLQMAALLSCDLYLV
jgi:hypothetical protein